MSEEKQKDEEPKGSVQDRIKQLSRKAGDAERAAAAQSAENEKLRQQLQQLESQVTSLTQSRSTSQPTAEQSLDAMLAPLQGAGKDAKQSSFDPSSLVGAIQKVVQQELAPLNERLNKSEKSAQLSKAQQTSFDRAAALHPDLSDPNSDLFKTFAQLWDGRQDLQEVEGSPELLAEAARGLLADAQRSKEVSKVAATATKPMVSRADGIVQTSDINEAKEALQTLTQTGRKEGWSRTEMEDYLKLKVATSGIAKED